MSTGVLPVTARTAALPRTLTWGLVLAAAAVVLLACALSAATPATAVAWGSCALAAWCTGLLCLTAAASGRDGTGLAQWKLGAWSLAWCAVTFGLATAAWSPAQEGSAAQLTTHSILRGLWLVAVAMTAWSAGYCAGPRRIAEKHAVRLTSALSSRFTPSVRSSAVPWILYGIGTAARLASAVTTGHLGDVGNAAAGVATPSGYQQALTLASYCAPLAIAAAALRAYGERAPGARVTLAVLFAAEVAYGALAGGKSPFVMAVLAVVIPFTAARRKVPKVVLAVAVIVFLAAVIPFTAAYRNAIHPGGVDLTPRQGISGAPAVFRVFTADVSLSVFPQSLAYMAQRVQEIDGPAIIMQRMPGQFPYASPAQLPEELVTDLIPRAVWPGKPIQDAGIEFSQQYYGFTGITYSAISPAGDLYRHGGWVPVLVGMFLLGLFVRILDDVLDVRNPHAVFLVLMLFPILVKAEDDWVSMFNGIPAILLTWFAVTAFSFARRMRHLEPWSNLQDQPAATVQMPETRNHHVPQGGHPCR
jgi:hypothetical protein